MEMITQLLNEIEKCLQKLHHSCVDHLNPGISSQQIQELFEKIPLQPTQDLRALYTWRNGSEDSEGITLGELAFFPWFLFDVSGRKYSDLLGTKGKGCLGQILVPNFCQRRWRFLCHELGSRSSGTNSWFLCI